VITAKETIYAGHHFRSRLEARWAVYFDALGIEWIYEPQTFTHFDYDGTAGPSYLPDFYLPECDLFVEVKGSLDNFNYQKMDEFVDCVLTNKQEFINFYGCTGGGGTLLVLSDIPKQGLDTSHLFMRCRKGTESSFIPLFVILLYNGAGKLKPKGWTRVDNPMWMLTFSTSFEPGPVDALQIINPTRINYYGDYEYLYQVHCLALDKARMARFEWGQNG